MSCLEMKARLQGYLKTIKVLFLLKKLKVFFFFNFSVQGRLGKGALWATQGRPYPHPSETKTGCKFLSEASDPPCVL